MRLRDMFNGERNESALDAEVQAELEALDKALAGLEVDPEHEGVAWLAAELRGNRESPEQDFAGRLDEWAAAGFPRGKNPAARAHARQSREHRTFTGRVRLNPVRTLAPVGAAAVLLVGLVAGLSQVELGDDDDSADSGSSASTVQAEDTGAGAGAGEFPTAAPEGLDSAGSAAKQAPDVAGFTGDEADSRALEAATLGDIARDSKGAAAGVDARKVERDAQLTLGTDPDNVQEVTNSAVDVVSIYDGIVLSSRISGGKKDATATLDLQIPTKNLDAALDDFRGLADVLSYSEGSTDITKSFVDAKDVLQGLRAERISVLNRIEQATTQEEVDQLKAQLAVLNQKIANAETELDKLQHRANQSSVQLTVTSDGAIDSDDDDWSIGDAIDDAGNVLTVVAGVALITAAVALPIALIAALLYFVIRAANNRARERALDE